MLLSINRQIATASLFWVGLFLFTFPSCAETIPEIKVAVTDHQCEPENLTVSQGKVRFIITNKSMRALEWEILEGVMVVAERENIAPGFYQKMTVNLEPGEYQTTCGLLTNPKGKLIVESNFNKKYQIKSADVVTVSAEYKFYLITTSQKLSSSDPEVAGRAYYALLPMAQAWGNEPTDLFDSHHPQRVKKQILSWQNNARKKTLSVDEILSQLQSSLHLSPVSQRSSTGLMTDIEKVVSLARPALIKVDPLLLKNLDSHLNQWKLSDTSSNREVIAQDLQTIKTYFTLEQ